MPTLDWIGKQAVVNHHRDVPYRLIHCDSELSAGDPDAGNLLVQGDNLEALRALLPYYAGQVKCIYIDPPYNTGNEGWVYNDNVNSPEISAWLNSVVGKEGEDLSRHDKWLCMMYPRLRLLSEFLRDDGVILVSIDDNEIHALRYLLQEVFKSNFISSLIWVNEGNVDNQSKIKQYHEYILIFEKRRGSFGLPALVDPNIDDDSKLSNPEIVNTIVKNGPKNPVSTITLPEGFPADFEKGVIDVPSSDFWPQFDQPIEVENFRLKHPVDLRSGWSSKAMCELFIQSRFNPLLDRKGQLTSFYITKSGALFNRKKRNESQSHVLSVLHNMGSVQESSSELKELGIEFTYPKPRRLIEYLLKMSTKPGDIVLDSFAGSGTTGHAVLELNQQDGGKRRFILIEMDKNIASDVTAERLRRVIDGYNKGGDNEKPLEGQGGGFRFCSLGVPLFDEFGDIESEVTFPDLAAHIFFSETGVPIPQRAQSEFLGTFQDRAVYLLFDETHAETPREAVGNVLTPDRLDALPPAPEGFGGTRIIYGEGCTVSKDRLKSAGAVFKQIPYQINGA
ncbi:site-specific DNA-methyltransferase [Aquisalinus flavus]|uniref:site-specific DNA-methyltransferase (adenine-specific) n=1 Tax=Aquisalinus flavus TaxID=1526572 RepID=A0A8J2V1W4_9PROT|nr:site-specific DNA-methyltransferase [Aquisalinus flavus]MBD0425803.1 site-specific DNA-methyltransferase [Aquisalinus flavus]UNE48591.1 site-specific DNA-methyltransferase [Aquisalinus flavus]GGD13104.1 adenine methyltransferase [Aquisalinus flavus]